MRDDPIRAALEAAALTLRQGHDVWCADHARDLAAAAIAAFLRAAPNRLMTDEYGTVHVGWFGQDLAAAVERAAKEAGDGDA